MPVLTDFEGREVVGSSIEIPNAAGGLREALKVDPTEMHLGDEFHVTFRCRVRKLRFDPVDREELEGPVHRVHVADAVIATLVDEELVGKALEDQAQRIQDAKEIEGQRKITDGVEPWLGFDELAADEVVERIEALDHKDGADEDIADRVEAYENANEQRQPILDAIKKWRAA